MTGSTSGEGTAYHSKAPELTTAFSGFCSSVSPITCLNILVVCCSVCVKTVSLQPFILYGVHALFMYTGVKQDFHIR